MSYCKRGHKKYLRGQNPRKFSCRTCGLAKSWRRRLGITLDEALLLLDERPLRCEACGSSTKVSLDHNEKTKERRGWLCGQCNMALGLVGENPKILRALAKYLDQRGFARTRRYSP